MALTLAKIATNTATVTLHYSGEDILIEYFPARITGRMLVEMQALSQVKEDNATASYISLIVTLCRLIKSWTIYEDEKETVMFPLEPERLPELPISLISQAFTAIMGDSRPEAQATQNGKLPT